MTKYDPAKSWTENTMAGVDMTQPEVKYFRVEEEFISAYPKRVEVLQDSEVVDGTEYETDECRYITLGYNVIEEDEQGITQNIEFYPVLTDMQTFDCNAQEVLDRIRRDYPASEWQNNNW